MSSAEFQGWMKTDLNLDGTESYNYEKAYGHVDISTITSQTICTIESYEKEAKTISGEINQTTDISNCTMQHSTMKQSMYQILTEIPEVLSAAGLTVSMNDLGFYKNLSQLYGINLGENETVCNIVNDVYTVVPANWTKKDTGDGNLYFYPPENEATDNSHVLMITTTKYTNDGGLGAFTSEQKEDLLAASLNSFRQDGFTMTDEQTGLQIGGFQGRTAAIVWHESIGDSDLNIVSFLVDGYRLEDYHAVIGYKKLRGAGEDHSDVYQKAVDSIYVDTDGSYTASLTGEVEEAAAPDENEQAAASAENEQAAAVDENDESNAASAIEEQLNGIWIYQTDDNCFEFENGSITISSPGNSISGTYTINMDESSIDAILKASDNDLNIHLPFTYENDVLTVYNNHGEALQKKHK